MITFVIFLAVIYGLIFGSFFNVLIYRLPLKKSVITPPSHCIYCNHKLKPWENLPVLSFIILKGKCSVCKEKIPPRYLGIEILTSFVTVLFTIKLLLPIVQDNFEWWMLISPILQILSLLILIPISIIDIKFFIIPDIFSISGIIIGLSMSFISGSVTPVESVMGVISGGGILLFIGWISEKIFKKEDAMGGGDIKLMAFIGAVFGWKIALLGISFGSIFGALIISILMAVKRINTEDKIPFGPYLALGCMVAVLWGNDIFISYLQFIDKVIYSN